MTARLAHTFDERASRLGGAVSHSEKVLASLHRSSLDRSVDQLRTISSNVTSLRKQLVVLTDHLQPRLERLASGPENDRIAAALVQRSSVPSIRIDPSAQQVDAAKQLQAIWRRHSAAASRHSTPADGDDDEHDAFYCPVVLRRAFVQGVRLPRSSFRASATEPAAAALPHLEPPNVIKSLGTEASSSSGGVERHFMSIL